MKKISIEKLKKVLSHWKNTRKKLFSEDKVFLISTKIILENLYFTPMTGLQSQLDIDKKDIDKKWTEFKDDYNPFVLYERFKDGGWDNKYPATLCIGDNYEMFFLNGNHRINIALKCKIDFIPFKFNYRFMPKDNSLFTHFTYLDDDGCVMGGCLNKEDRLKICERLMIPYNQEPTLLSPILLGLKPTWMRKDEF